MGEGEGIVLNIEINIVKPCKPYDSNMIITKVSINLSNERID